MTDTPPLDALWVNRIRFTIDALTSESREIKRRLASLETDAIAATEERNKLNLSISRRAMDATHAAVLREQYAQQFAELTERVDAPEAAEQRLHDIKVECAKLEKQIPASPPMSITETLHAWGVRK